MKRNFVLLVEDDEELIDPLTEQMQSWGHTVVIATTVPAALIKINNQRFGVILLDIMLRKASGLKIVEHSRRHTSSFNKTTPIILHSGHIESEIFLTYRSEINDAIVKPSQSDMIRQKLEYWKDRRHNIPTSANLSFIKDYIQLMKSRRGPTVGS